MAPVLNRFGQVVLPLLDDAADTGDGEVADDGWDLK